MSKEPVILLLITLTLVLIGILMVFSAGTVRVFESSDLSSTHFLTRQLIFVAVGLAAMFALARTDYHILREPWVYRGLAFGTLLLLVLVLIPGIGAERGGAQRWIQLGAFSFQPSEIAKFTLIVVVAAKLAQNQDHVERFWKGFLPPLIITGVFAGLIVLERDLGTPVVIFVVSGAMVVMAGTRWLYALGSLAPMGAAVFALIYTSPHRLSRLLTFQNPWEDRADTGYQLIQSLTAFAAGSIWGRGLGAGEQKLFYLPEAHTDFIFAVYGEETGLVGGLFLVTLFAVLAVAAMRVAMNSPDMFGALLAGGVGMLITFQAVFNMAVTVGLVPTKGLPLPFISAGGTALIVNLALMGVLLNVALHASGRQRRPGPEPSL